MTTDDDIDSSHSLGDVLIDGEAGVTQSDDLIHAQRLQFVYLLLHRRHLVLKPQVRSWSCQSTTLLNCTNICILILFTRT